MVRKSKGQDSLSAVASGVAAVTGAAVAAAAAWPAAMADKGVLSDAESAFVRQGDCMIWHMLEGGRMQLVREGVAYSC
jgi:hypothetical protein